MHGFLHPVPVNRLFFYLLPLAAAYHFRGAVLVRVNHLHKVLVRRHEGTLQIRNQLSHGLVSPVRAFLAALKDNLLHAHRNFRNIVSGRGHFLLNMLDGNCHRGFPVKGHPPGKHFKHGNSKGIHVALFVGIASPCLFRGSIVNRAHHIGGNGIAGRRLGDAEIRNLYLPLL